jgi:carboxylesterase
MKKRGLLILILIFIIACSLQYKEPPEKDYHEGRVKLMKDIESAKAKNIIADNLPFLLETKNSTKAILLIHGFTATPWEMREFAEYLHKNGFIVYGTLLPGHGTSSSDLKDVPWERWYDKTVSSYLALSQMADQVYVIGQSTGGALGILLAENYDVDGLISLSTPVYLRDRRAKFAWLIKFFKPTADADIKETDKIHYYKDRPITAIEQLNQLIKAYTKRLCSLETPILIIQATNDTTILPESADYLFENIYSYEKIIWINSTEHVLITSKHKNEIFKLGLDFIEDLNKRKDLNNSIQGCIIKKGDDELQYAEGILQIAVVFLSIVAGILALSLFKSSFKKDSLKSWIPLIFALILFAAVEILGALRSFKIFETPYLTHILPTFIMGFIIWALVVEINYGTCTTKIKKVRKK